MSNILEANNLTKKFGSTTTLNHLNLTVNSNDIVCLLGGNGAGKTTTLNLFLGFLAPDEGYVRVVGKDPIKDAKQVRAAIGYVPESVALYPKLTGIENLQFFHQLNSSKAVVSNSVLLQALSNIGLSKKAAFSRTETYSKGMRQKIGLALALLKNSQALLLDEPLSGLDPDAANQFQELVLNAANEGAGILMVTHDIFRAKELATKIGIMKNGNLVDFFDAGNISHIELEELYLKYTRDA